MYISNSSKMYEVFTDRIGRTHPWTSKTASFTEKQSPAHPAVYDDFPENLLPELAEYLKSHGIGKLYCHQTEMFEKVTSGKNAVITTPTASGKTLSFLLPVLQDILKNR